MMAWERDEAAEVLLAPCRPILFLFFLALNKSLAPLLESRLEYVRENGREWKLIKLLDEGEGQGYAI
jgi:hypothetical protein